VKNEIMTEDLPGQGLTSAAIKEEAHKIRLEDLYRQLNSSPSGLSSEEALLRRKRLGANCLEAAKKKPLVIRFGRHLVNFFALLLWTGAALSLVADRVYPGQGNLFIGMALSGVVVLNAIFTFIQEYQSEKIIESLSKMMPSAIEVMRDGARMKIHTADIVPGDVLFLDEGDRVPADGPSGECPATRREAGRRIHCRGRNRSCTGRCRGRPHSSPAATVPPRPTASRSHDRCSSPG